MKAKKMGKVSVTLFLMLMVALFLTSCNGVVTPELQLDPEEDINKLEEIGYVCLDVPELGWFYKKYALPLSGKMEKGRAITSYNFQAIYGSSFLCCASYGAAI